jgi:hypothetical protein
MRFTELGFTEVRFTRLRFAKLLFAAPFIVVAGLMLPALRGARSAPAPQVNELLDALVSSYPDALVRHDETRIYWRDGTVMDVTDGNNNKSFDELLRNASILDQFHLLYPRGHLPAPPAMNADPGRFRNDAFFRKMYGDCRKGEVERNMAAITWLPRTPGVTVKGAGKTLRVSKVNGIAGKLQQISDEIDQLPAAIKQAAWPSDGVYNCRPVADTGKMSAHAYAVAVDLNADRADYWRWSAKGAGPIPYKNRVPQEIVDIFEKYGFIWGGKWYHYDTMHFEYRPELLAAAPP